MKFLNRKPFIIKHPAFDFGCHYEIYRIPIKECGNCRIGTMFLRKLCFDYNLPNFGGRIRVDKPELDLICNYCRHVEMILGDFCIGHSDEYMEIKA